ncbi:MAG: hypothetical protein ACP5P1_04630 [Acidimicrobiales bacterium]
MGKASSSKKVARAAGIGSGKGRRRRTPWGYFAVIAVIVVLGLAGTVTSRNRLIAQINNAGGTAPTVGTTWYEGYAVYACGKFLPDIKVPAADPQGITTTQNGIITVAPKVKSVAGKNATLDKFASAVGMKLNAAELQLPGGHLYLDGNTCEGQPGHVYIKQFAYVGDTVGELYNGAKNQLPKLDPTQVPFINGDLITIAFVPSGKASSIPAPPASVGKALSALQAASSSTGTATTVPSASATTVPAAKSSVTTAPKPAATSSPSTTSKGSTSTTVTKG